MVVCPSHPPQCSIWFLTVFQVLLLSIKAELENVTDLVPASDDFEYFFQVKCTSCNETHPKEVAVNPTVRLPLRSSG
jgi:hypothetical protein